MKKMAMDSPSPKTARTERLSIYILIFMATGGLGMAAFSGGVFLKGPAGNKLSRMIEAVFVQKDNSPAIAAAVPAVEPVPFPKSQKDNPVLLWVADRLDRISLRIAVTEYDLRELQRNKFRISWIDWVAGATTIVGLLQGVFGLAIGLLEWRRRKAS